MANSDDRRDGETWRLTVDNAISAYVMEGDNPVAFIYQSRYRQLLLQAPQLARLLDDVIAADAEKPYNDDHLLRSVRHIARVAAALKAEREALMDVRTVDCIFRGSPTVMTETERRDRCWELETRIRRDPELAAKMLAAIRGEVRHGD
jgi:hypothetical protein